MEETDRSSLLSSPETCANQAAFDGVLPLDPFGMRDLLDLSVAAAGPEKASSSPLNPAGRRAVLPLLRLAAEVGQSSSSGGGGAAWCLLPSAPHYHQVAVFCLSG